MAIDAIALIESGLAQRCDAVVAVLAPRELRLRRIMARDGIDEEYARRRVLAQQGDDFFRDNSDHTLENGVKDTEEHFRERALELFRELLAWFEQTVLEEWKCPFCLRGGKNFSRPVEH